MRTDFLRLVIVILVATGAAARGDDRPVDSESASGDVVNFSLLDYRGKVHELRRSKAKVIVLHFTGFHCPIARQNVPKLQDLAAEYKDRGVVFWMVNSATAGDPGDGLLKIIAELGARGQLDKFIPNDSAGKETLSRIHSMTELSDVLPQEQLLGDREEFRLQVLEGTFGHLTLLRDENQLVAHHFNARRLCEVIAIDVERQAVIYRGALDDQMVPGAQKPAPTQHFLKAAIDEFLAGKPVSKPQTTPEGCLISYAAPLKKAEISYRDEIAPILERKCVNCHSEGNIGPFALASYADVMQWSAMIEEVILDRRMPPWDADPHFGKFANDLSLSQQESQLLARWIRLGSPRGEGDDPLASERPVASKWTLGEPDFIVPLPERQEIPATGVLNYRYLDSTFAMPQDAWLRAAVCRPDNPKVVHHIIVRMRYPKDYQGERAESFLFTTWAPGVPQGECPPDTGVFVPKGATFNFEVHYTTNGFPQTDLSEMGLYLSKVKPRMRLDCRVAETRDLNIPPGDPNAEHVSHYCFKRDALLFDIGPHMHVRGSWFKFQLLTPDGRRETLLNVPRYDFNWQTGHYFEKPMRVPAGSWLICTGGFDNSAQNPSNPDPTKRVRFGLQTWDEMFMGFMTVADLPETNTTSEVVTPTAEGR
jgi:hypothetical protein